MSEFTVDNLQRKDIVSVTKAYIEHMVPELEGDEDITAFLMVQPKDTDGQIDKWHLLAMLMPGDPDTKNRIADYLTAACCVYNAEEVVFASAGWSVKNPCKEELDMAPSDSPLREEDVFIVHSTRFTGDTVGHHSCPIIRRDNKVYLGPWTEMVGVGAVGRFAEAITLGLKLAVEMPPDVREGVESMVAEGQENKLLSAMANMVSGARKTAREMLGDKNDKNGDMLLGDTDE